MKRPDSSLNEQFNDQYAKGIETIRERAIWRVGEQVTDLDQFRCQCTNCGYDSVHQRFDIARHRLLFGRSIRQIEAARPMARCQRCGVLRHTRDIDELVVPTTRRLRDLALAEIPPAGERSATLGPSLTAALTAFREEASLPICRAFLGEVAGNARRRDASFVEAVGGALFISSEQIAAVVSDLD